MALSGNKGEWSEPYVFLKLLGDKNLKIGDENLNPIKDLIYPIISVIRIESGHRIEFSYDDEVVVVTNGEEIRIPIKMFIDNAKLLFNKIKTTKGNFEYTELETFLESVNVKTLKAKSKDKSDITIQIHDFTTLMQPVLGFSIKSQMGSPSTLVNASGATNFLFKIVGNVLDEKTISEINGTEYFSDKIAMLQSNNCHLEFIEVDNNKFNTNLQTIDTYFPEIISELLVLFYANSNPKKNTVKQFFNEITSKNSLKYDTKANPDIYNIKMKRFLTDYALGMRAATIWKGKYEATGGYIIVKNDGDIVCYHFYYKNQFEDYLFNNTKMETPDPKKHKFGSIYKDNSGYYIKLNLQIRFMQ